MKLVPLIKWAKEIFEVVPHTRTLQKWCANGDLPARKIGGVWYIDKDAFENSTGNDLADQILNSSKRSA